MTQMKRHDPVRVVVIDDCELVTAGVARMMEPYAERVRLVDVEQTFGPPVDVVLRGQDVRMIGLDTPCGAIVEYSWHPEPGPGALSKTLGAADLVRALEHIADPDTSWPREAGRESWPGERAGLSVRESEVLALIAVGLTNEQVAARAYLSINTVKSYIRTAYRKMGVKSRSQAVLWAVDHGFGAKSGLPRAT